MTLSVTPNPDPSPSSAVGTESDGMSKLGQLLRQHKLPHQEASAVADDGKALEDKGSAPETTYVRQNNLSLLSVIGERLRTQDNRCTSNPMFCVQEKVTIYGMDPRWSDDIVWIEIDDGVREVKPPRNRKETDTIQKSAKKSYWHTVMVAFTEVGCQEYLERNGHNHRGATRIYVESFNRCPEMTAIRSALMEAPSVSDRGGSLAAGVSSPNPSASPVSSVEQK